MMSAATRALARLADANPVRDDAIGAAVPRSWSDELLARILTEPVEQPAASARRGDRYRLAYVALAAALVATALGAPAFGLGRTIIDFFAAEPAAENVRLSFAEMEKIARPTGAGVIASQARKVYVFRTPSGDRVLSLAPTESGSFCWAITDFPGGCQTILSAQGPFQPGERNPAWIGLVFTDIPAPAMPQEPVLIGGNLRAASSDRLELEFQDGETMTIPFVWVAAPIEAGFFLYELPRERWAEGKRPLALTLYAADGTVLSRVTFSVASTIEEYEASAARNG